MISRSKKIILIGLGPHAKRIYINGLEKFGLKPTVVVEVKSKEFETRSWLQNRGISCAFYFVDDYERDELRLSDTVQRDLDRVISKYKISYSIISTEPKSHLAYIRFFSSRKIRMLVDKPLTAPKDVANFEGQAMKIREDYFEIADFNRKHDSVIEIQCQRRFDPRYNYIKKLIDETSQEYNIPVTHMQVYHCDGQWNMPNEYTCRENHPYKYGYGKLFHSGYHFIDLANYLLSWDNLPANKRPDRVVLNSSSYSPKDHLFTFDENFYQKLFPNSDYSSVFSSFDKGQYRGFGELDFNGQIQWKRGNFVVSNLFLNLIQSGFSRRAWTHLPENAYKANGRVRHESLNIQMGPLLNIQVHSYQAHEVASRSDQSINHNDVGGLEHFEIFIFRNTDLIGGLPFQKILGKDLLNQDSSSDGSFQGFNELARERCLVNFLMDREPLSSIKEHRMTIELLMLAYQSLGRNRHSKDGTVGSPLTFKQEQCA